MMKLAAIAVLVGTLATLAAGQNAGEEEIFARSLVTLGDTARLQHALAKARRGEEVCVGVIGGSITAGAAATTEEKRWGNLVAKWWTETFPEAEIKFVNAGIGATGSNLGAHRAQFHLLPHEPDFVVAEYGVNDPNSEFAAETLEGLVRQVLKLPDDPAVMLLFTMHGNGGNAQEWHGKVGEHYGLPMVSFRDAIWPEIEAGRLTWEDVEADVVHPNDRGHQYCADFITRALGMVLAELPEDDALPAVAPMPEPLLSDTFERTTFADAKSLTPLVNEGWETVDTWLGQGWEASEPGSALEFEVEGTTVSLAHYRIKGDMGIATVQIDDAEPQPMQGWFEADWGGYCHFHLAARDLEPGKHRVRIELTQETAEASNGHKFQVWLVMSAGLLQPAN